MTPLAKFDPDTEAMRRSIDHILEHAPVMHLTLREVISTLRLIRLHASLADRQYGDVYVHNNDVRLQYCDDTDRFLALLLECEQHRREQRIQQTGNPDDHGVPGRISGE